MFRLVEQADVFLTNFRSSTLTRYGLDVAGVRARNPRVIYACGHGFGARGRHADRPGYDASAFWARGGVGATLTTADATEPVAMRPAFGDHTAAMNLAFGVAAALYKRERTGEPSVVDTSLLATAMWTLSSDVLSAFNPGYVGGATTRAPQQSPLAGTFKTADGRWITLVFMEPDRYWDPFCRHIGRDDLAVDDRFREGGARTENAARVPRDPGRGVRITRLRGMAPHRRRARRAVGAHAIGQGSLRRRAGAGQRLPAHDQ